MPLTDLHPFVASDGEPLQGLLFRPEGSARHADLAIVYTHGVADNCSRGPLPVIAKGLAERGYPGLTINTRGHDWVARGGADGTRFIGATYELFEECVHDLQGAIESLQAIGFSRFVLVGHSLGAVKTVFFQGTSRRRDVAGVVACSAPRQFYSVRVLEQPEFPRRLEEAEAMIASGRPEELIWAPTSGSMGVFTARTYVSKYGRHERNDIRPHASQLDVPLLALAGGAEPPAFEQHVRELVERAGASGTGHMVADAVHSYAGREHLVIATIADWLAGIGLNTSRQRLLRPPPAGGRGKGWVEQ